MPEGRPHEIDSTKPSSRHGRDPANEVRCGYCIRRLSQDLGTSAPLLWHRCCAFADDRGFPGNHACRGLVPIMHSKSAFDIAVGTGMNAATDGYWSEAAIHVSMSGVRAAMVSEGALTSADATALGLARASMNASASAALQL